jgi:hypothetical protein
VAKIAGLVHNWARAIAGVFYDLALLDVDQRWSVGVTMPRHDAARGACRPEGVRPCATGLNVAARSRNGNIGWL